MTGHSERMESDESLRDRIYEVYGGVQAYPHSPRSSLDAYSGKDLESIAFLYKITRESASSDPFGDAVRAAQDKADAEMKSYVPEKHDSFDVDHVWAVTMGMAR